MRVNCKSIEQYQAERTRRRKVMELSDKGLTQEEISRQLGVSSKTVSRDQHRLARYLQGQQNRQVREFYESIYKRIDALPQPERFELCLEAIGLEQDRPGKGLQYTIGYLNSREKEGDAGRSKT
jgi:transcriptional regulator